MSKRIETEAHRHVYAAEQISKDREDWTELEAPEKREAVSEWLEAHPDIVVGAEVAK